jgi:hypothetical protein
VSIARSNVTARGVSGIGGDGVSSVARVIIADSQLTVHATRGHAGIWSGGETLPEQSLVLSGDVRLTCDSDLNPIGVDFPRITVASATVYAESNGDQRFRDAPTVIGPPNFVVISSTIGGSPSMLIPGPVLQLGILTFPTLALWSLSLIAGDHSKTLTVDSMRTRSLQISLPAGSYTINAMSSRYIGLVELPGGDFVFTVDASDPPYFSQASVVLLSPLPFPAPP